MPSFSTDFGGYLVPSSREIADAIKNGLIVLDTNVLLGAYRFAFKAREELLSVLEQTQDRLWIPHQVAYEFHKNRFEVITEHDAAYKDLLDTLDRHRKATVNEIEGKIRQLSNRVALTEKERDRLVGMTRQGWGSLQKAVEDLHRSHQLHEPTATDPVLERLERIFKDRVGKKYTEEQLQRAKMEGERRIKETIPPGYKDASKTENCGDYFVWEQTLAEASARKPSYLLFITGDVKEDWYLRVKGKTIIGRPELAEECATRSGARLIMAPTKSFLRYAQEYLNADVSTETLQQAGKVSANPGFNQNLDMTNENTALLRQTLNQLSSMADDLAVQETIVTARIETLRSVLQDFSFDEAEREGIQTALSSFETELTQLQLELKTIARQRRAIKQELEEGIADKNTSIFNEIASAFTRAHPPIVKLTMSQAKRAT